MVKPLFVKDRSTLLEGLRLTESTESSSQQIDDAILDVRTGFYREIGVSRVDEIKATAHTEEPVTDAELARSLAESVERKWIRSKLLRTMPTFFMQGTAQHQQAWNDEGLLRDADFRLEGEIKRLQSEVECGLRQLVKAECLPNVAVIGPTEKNSYPGSSIFP